MMKRTAVILSIALAMGTSLAAAQTLPVNSQPKSGIRLITENGMQLTCEHIDAPAYYRVPESDKGFSNGYSDNSFTIDWPLRINGKEATILQNVLLDKFAVTDFETGQVTYRPSSINDVVEHRTQCRFSEKAQRVAGIVDDDPEYCLKDIMNVTVYRLNPAMIGFEIAQDQYYGGGTGASVLVGSYFLNYDLEYDRLLTTEECFTPGLENVIAADLQADAEMWDFLWEDYKNAPFVPDNFRIDTDSITFFFPKYSIAPGAAGIVEVTLPYDRILPYATKSLNYAMNGHQEVVGGYDDQSKIKIYKTVQQMPMYLGGDTALLRDVSKNLVYPPEAIKSKTEGRVLLMFIVDKQGRVGEVKIINSVSPEIDQAAINAVKKLGRFEPGRDNGTPVNVWYTLPLNFKL